MGQDGETLLQRSQELSVPAHDGKYLRQLSSNPTIRSQLLSALKEQRPQVLYTERANKMRCQRRHRCHLLIKFLNQSQLLSFLARLTEAVLLSHRLQVVAMEFNVSAICLLGRVRRLARRELQTCWQLVGMVTTLWKASRAEGSSSRRVCDSRDSCLWQRMCQTSSPREMVRLPWLPCGSYPSCIRLLHEGLTWHLAATPSCSNGLNSSQ
jgi:hypothetical protein